AGDSWPDGAGSSEGFISATRTPVLILRVRHGCEKQCDLTGLEDLRTQPIHPGVPWHSGIARSSHAGRRLPRVRESAHPPRAMRGSRRSYAETGNVPDRNDRTLLSGGA